MDSQLVAVGTTIVGIALGVLITWLLTRGRAAAAADKARAEVSAELATASERATRVPALEAQVDNLGRQLAAAQQDFLKISTSEAEKAQALLSATTRLNELEQSVKDRDQKLSNTAADLARSNEKRSALEAEAARIPELEKKLAGGEQALALAQQQTAELRETSGRVMAELKAERETLVSLRGDFSQEKAQRELSEARASELATQLEGATTQLEAERSRAAEKLALLQDAQEVMSNRFKTVANEILEEKTKKFTEQNQTNLGQLLEPLRTKIQEFQGKVETVHDQDNKDRSALCEQVRQLMELNQTLSQDAKNLTSALKGSSKTQGDWGELVLEHVLESSGLRKGHEYVVQENHKDEDGQNVRPDVIIHLPEDRHLVVDAKVSLVAYEEFCSAEDDAAREQALCRHLDSVRGHMKGLSGKNYQKLHDLKSLDFVLMFVPIEPAFMLAVTNDREFFNDALRKNVLLVSPSTLLFVVRTVAHLWRQEAQTRNAKEIAQKAANLYDKLVGFVTDLESVGKRLKQAQKDYDDAHAKLTSGKGNLIRKAEELIKLGVKPTKALPGPMLEEATEEEVDGPLALVEDAQAGLEGGDGEGNGSAVVAD